jgi:hypothetical protein
VSVADHRAAEAEPAEAPREALRGADAAPPSLQAGWAPTTAAVLALQRAAGNRAATTAIQRTRAPQRVLARLGYPLGKPLPKGAERPLFGDFGDQRRYSVDQFERMWEKQFHALSDDEQLNVFRGCIGITATNLGIGSDKHPPLGEVYGRFDQARQVVAQRNKQAGPIDPTKPISVWVLFAMLFWSGRGRRAPDTKAFRPDPVSGRVDMSGIGNIYDDGRPGFVNFDFGFWDELTHSFWHANHGVYQGMETPEEIYQSTHGRFARRFWAKGEEHVTYADFDRVVYGVAQTTIMPEKVITDAPPVVYSRNELLAAFKAQLARGEYADCALRLGGFDDKDITRLARSMTHDQRTAVIAAAPGAMPGYSDRVVNALTLVDKEPPPRAAVLSALDASIAKKDWGDVALRLNGLSDDDLRRRLKKLSQKQREAVADAAPGAMPGFSGRVTDAILALEGAAAR